MNALSLSTQLSSSGLTGRSSTPRPLDYFSGVSGILDRPVEPGDDGWECGAFVSQDVAAIFKA
jgi:hypothetical protein